VDDLLTRQLLLETFGLLLAHTMTAVSSAAATVDPTTYPPTTTPTIKGTSAAVAPNMAVVPDATTTVATSRMSRRLGNSALSLSKNIMLAI
jgi:hypothetical protein